MQDLNDILNGVTDGTKDLTVNALTCNGAVSLKGTVALGDATADDISHAGSLATSIPIKTNNAFAIGSATLGLSGIFMGNAGLGATCQILSASHATTRNYSIPDCGAAANFVMSQGTQTVAGLSTFSGGVQYASTGGTPATLNYYEDGTFTATFTQTGGYSQAVTVRFNRIGNIVMLAIPGFVGSATATAKITAATTLPSRLRPAQVMNKLLMVVNAAANVANGLLIINTNGTLDLYSSVNESNFTSGSNAGLYLNGASDFQSVSYTIS